MISSPLEEERVPFMTQINGTYSNEYKDKDLWIVVQPINSPAYHPQTSKIPKFTNNKWTSVAYIGESESTNINDGASGNSVGNRVKIEVAEVKKNGDSHSGFVAKPTGRLPHCFNT
ncbi:MAG: hypothetical protein HGB12_12055, partial [Bacteroidetes bacterium]|nr:hypothetical protein [Bacteroidota bacterium]